MRAIYLKADLIDCGTISLEGEFVHHLNVVRLKTNEEILILNGLGRSALANVLSLTKKEIIVEIKKIEEHRRNHNIALAIALPKKDAFEDILRISTELGVTEIFPLLSDFSQYSYRPSERVDRLIESALIQSNNMFAPIIHPEQKLSEFLKNNSTPIVYFSSRPVASSLKTSSGNKCVVLIGPEGGFSSTEETEILDFTTVNQIHLPTPILRAPTAVATSIGYLLS